MRVPVMQQEWQRRQSQRSVWVLLGLLAVVSAGAAEAPAVALWLPAPEAVVQTVEPAAPTATERQRRAVRTASSARYWRHLAPVEDELARQRLTAHAAPRPVSSSLDCYLRRFLRPPTP